MFLCAYVCLQVPVDEVCGCPLVRNVFDPTGEYCRVSKRKCNKHYCWEKLRRAEVDLERVRVVSEEASCQTLASQLLSYWGIHSLVFTVHDRYFSMLSMAYMKLTLLSSHSSEG